MYNWLLTGMEFNMKGSDIEFRAFDLKYPGLTDFFLKKDWSGLTLISLAPGLYHKD